MKDAQLVLDARTLKLGVAGPATASFFLQVGSANLPMVGWNDFVVVVLGWWTEALLRLLNGQSSREEVRFMDGPYSVLLQSHSDEVLRLRFLSRANGPKETDFGEVAITPLVESIVKGAEEILAGVRALGAWSSDEETLETAVASLRRARQSRLGS